MSRLAALLGALLIAAGPANAHHAFAADYEAGNEGTVSGVITEVMFRNPHARYYLEVTGDDGGKELWDLETLNLMMLGRMGWDKNTLKVGDHVTVTGILGRNNTKRMSIVTVTLPGGRTISPFRSNTRTNVELNAGGDAGNGDEGDRAFASLASNVSPGLYELDDTHAYLTFAYSHMGLSNPTIHFEDFEAALTLDGRDMSNSHVEIRIDAASVSTGVEALDNALRGEEYFDVAKHPVITFRSTGYEELSPNTGRLTGELTVIGVTRPARLDVSINSASMNRMTRKEMIGFSASGRLRRSDFGLTAFEDLVGDELQLDVEVEFVRANEQPERAGAAP